MLSLDALRRWPDIEAPNLHASDAADRLILETAAAAISKSRPSQVAVIGDRYGALTLGAADLGASKIRVHQDPLSGERALAANARTVGFESEYRSLPTVSELVTGVEIVLLRLPRSLDELAEVVDLIATSASPQVTVFAGGMVKHLTLAMNEVLGSRFHSVTAGLARQKARVITATGALPSTVGGAPASSWPRSEYHGDLDMWVSARGGVFAGTKVDIGTRFLLGFLGQAKPDAQTILDLGCGTGILAVSLARARHGANVIATDQSAAATASALATAEANGVAGRVIVRRDDGASLQPYASVDLVVLNPPFHVGAAVHTGAATRLFSEASRILRPGGELWAVWNSHLGYTGALERAVGPTRQVGRSAKFTVTVSTRR